LCVVSIHFILKRQFTPKYKKHIVPLTVLLFICLDCFGVGCQVFERCLPSPKVWKKENNSCKKLLTIKFMDYLEQLGYDFRKDTMFFKV